VEEEEKEEKKGGEGVENVEAECGCVSAGGRRSRDGKG